MSHDRLLQDCAKLLQSNVATWADLLYAAAVVLVLYTGLMVGSASALHPADYHAVFHSFFTLYSVLMRCPASYADLMHCFFIQVHSTGSPCATAKFAINNMVSHQWPT
jgi:hypothetical protein